VQTRVCSHLATKKLMSFRHDQRQMLARGPHENTDADDGEVVAQYGQTKVYVNLGDVNRKVGPFELGPYGWCAVLDGGAIVNSEDIR